MAGSISCGSEYDESSLDSFINSLATLKLFRKEGRCGATSCVSSDGEDGRAAATAHAFVVRASSLVCRGQGGVHTAATGATPLRRRGDTIIQSADATMVAVLTKLSDHNWRFARDPVDTAKSAMVVPAVLAEHVDEQHHRCPGKKQERDFLDLE
uniref:Uncharacterized protein n=1 Tax=Oryza meridionalis TaxID=40149 RepID=A0A0E0CNY1_9ORYZ